MSLSYVYANRVKRKKKKKEVPFISVKFLFLVVLAGLHFKEQTLTKGVDISRAAFYKVTFNFKMRTHTLNMQFWQSAWNVDHIWHLWCYNYVFIISHFRHSQFHLVDTNENVNPNSKLQFPKF